MMFELESTWVHRLTREKQGAPNKWRYSAVVLFHLMITQLSHYNQVRPSTAGGWGSRSSFDSSKRFKSDFPNLPGFRQTSSMRPRTPKVTFPLSLMIKLKGHTLDKLIISFLFAYIFAGIASITQLCEWLHDGKSEKAFGSFSSFNANGIAPK